MIEKKLAIALSWLNCLLSCGDIFVVDGFAVAHRSDASITGIAKFLPSVAGLLLENEVSALQAAIDHPQQPVLAITGGSKLETKLPLLEKFMKLADQIVVAGVMANTLLVAQGYNIGESVYDKDEIPKAKEMLDLAKASNVSLVLPSRQVAVGKSLADKKRRDVSLKDVEEDDLILDFGDESIVEVLELISQARTIIWNGPLGYYENPVFAKGSQMVAKAIAASMLVRLLVAAIPLISLIHLGLLTISHMYQQAVEPVLSCSLDINFLQLKCSRISKLVSYVKNFSI
jgi:phosphoglycerate kinase